MALLLLDADVQALEHSARCTQVLLVVRYVILLDKNTAAYLFLLSL